MPYRLPFRRLRKNDDKTASDASEAQKTAEVIKFGTNAEFPPFSLLPPTATTSSTESTYASQSEIAEQNGATAKIENMEFDSLLVALQNKQIDAVIAGMTATDERKESVNFSTPYYKATQVMIVKEDSTIAKAADMADKKIVVIQGYTGETCVKDMGYNYESFKKGTEAVMELVNGQVRCCCYRLGHRLQA